MEVKTRYWIAFALAGAVTLGILAGPLPKAKRHATRIQCVNSICAYFPPPVVSTNKSAP
jgi:hypothetical protein